VRERGAYATSRHSCFLSCVVMMVVSQAVTAEAWRRLQAALTAPCHDISQHDIRVSIINIQFWWVASLTSRVVVFVVMVQSYESRRAWVSSAMFVAHQLSLMSILNHTGPGPRPPMPPPLSLGELLRASQTKYEAAALTRCARSVLN
jgi:hypothetical protein